MGEHSGNLFCLIFLGASIALGFVATRFFGGREDRDASRVMLTLVAFAVLCGGALRFYGVDFGLPTPYHPDELQKATFLREMMAEGRIDPEFNLQPPLLLYLSWGVSKLLEPLGYFPDSTIVRNLLAGRLVSAFLGTLSIWLVFALGRRAFTPLVGAVAAVLLAFSPLHVTNSRYMKEDVLFLTFILGCALSALKARDDDDPRFLYFAGLLAGLSLGAKYTGVVSFVIVLGAAWLDSERMRVLPDWRWLRHSLVALLFMPIGFFATVPYLLVQGLDGISSMIAGFQSESRHAMRGHMGLAIDPWSQLWMFHFRRSLIPGLGALPVFFGLVGTGVVLRRFKPRELFIVALVLLFYLPAEWAKSKPPPQPDRYVIACAPFLVILAGYALQLAVARFSAHRRTLVMVGATAALVFLPLVRTVALARDLRNDTRRQMTDWLAENLPPGTKILTAGGTTYLCRIPQRLQGVSLREVVGKDKSRIVEQLRESPYGYLLTTNLTDNRFTVGNTKKEGIRKAFEDIRSSFRIVKEIRAPSGSYGFHNPTLTLYALKDAAPPQGQQ